MNIIYIKEEDLTPELIKSGYYKPIYVNGKEDLNHYLA